ncbi:hypothetical protein BZA77DRAFT_367519 [Pyronema omphalodes]|nr:hypothetical protein BZA77DRAFT_367519 [Pyronema omphalodes]
MTGYEEPSNVGSFAVQSFGRQFTLRYYDQFWLPTQVISTIIHCSRRISSFYDPRGWTWHRNTRYISHVGNRAIGNPAIGYPANGYPANGYPANGYSANGYPANGYPANGNPAIGNPTIGYPAIGYPVIDGPNHVVTGNFSSVSTNANLNLRPNGNAISRIRNYTECMTAASNGHRMGRQSFVLITHCA